MMHFPSILMFPTFVATLDLSSKKAFVMKINNESLLYDPKSNFLSSSELLN